MALFFNGQCRVANSKYYSSQTTKCKIQFDCDVKAMKWLVSAGHVILHFTSYWP